MREGSRTGAALGRLKKRFDDYRTAHPGLTRFQILRIILTKIVRGDAYRSLKRQVRTVDNLKPLRRSKAERAALADKPSIVIAALPGSGAHYVKSKLAHTVGCTANRLLGVGEFPSFTLKPWMVREFGEGGLTASAPIPCTAANRRLLCQHALTKIVLHVRDPRALVWNRVRAPGVPGRAALDAGDAPFHAMSHVQQLDRCIDRFLPDCIAWLSAWVRFLDKDDREIEVLVVRHVDLVMDEEAYFGSIYAFYGCALQQENIVPRSGRAASRVRGTDWWRDDVARPQIERMTRMIPLHLFEHFGWRR